MMDDVITVTARKREENLQEVPVAVSVVQGEMLEDSGAADIAELQANVPNLSIYPGRNQSTTLTAFMRGIGQADPLWGVDPGVGLYLDDVYIARPQGALLDVYDVAADRGPARPAGHPLRQEHDRRRHQVRQPGADRHPRRPDLVHRRRLRQPGRQVQHRRAARRGQAARQDRLRLAAARRLRHQPLHRPGRVGQGHARPIRVALDWLPSDDVRREVRLSTGPRTTPSPRG